MLQFFHTLVIQSRLIESCVVTEKKPKHHE